MSTEFNSPLLGAPNVFSNSLAVFARSSPLKGMSTSNTTPSPESVAAAIAEIRTVRAQLAPMQALPLPEQRNRFGTKVADLKKRRHAAELIVAAFTSDYEKLIRGAMKRFGSKTSQPGKMPYDVARSVATEHLLKATTTFKAGSGAFPAWAKTRVQYGMCDAVSTETRVIVPKKGVAANEVTVARAVARLGAGASVLAVAVETGLTEGLVRATLEGALQVGGLPTGKGDGEDSEIGLPSEPSAEDTAIAAADQRQTLTLIIAGLTQKSRTALTGSLGGDLSDVPDRRRTNAELGAELGVTGQAVGKQLRAAEAELMASPSFREAALSLGSLRNNPHAQRALATAGFAA